MIRGAHKVPARHLSIRVLWHDGGRVGIVHGDKGVSRQNSSSRAISPDRESAVANAEVGLVLGPIRTKNKRGLLKNLPGVTGCETEKVEEL